MEAEAWMRTLAAQGGLGARTLVARLKCSTRQLLKPLATGPAGHTVDAAGRGSLAAQERASR